MYVSPHCLQLPVLSFLNVIYTSRGLTTPFPPNQPFISYFIPAGGTYGRNGWGHGEQPKLLKLIIINIILFLLLLLK